MSSEKWLPALRAIANEGMDLVVAAKLVAAYPGESAFLDALARHPQFSAYKVVEIGRIDVLLALGPARLGDEDVIFMLRRALGDAEANPDKIKLAKAIIRRFALASPPLKPFLFELATNGEQTSRSTLLKWATELDKETPPLGPIASDVLGEKEFVKVKDSQTPRSELSVLLKAAKAGEKWKTYPPKTEERLNNLFGNLEIVMNMDRSLPLAGSLYLAEEIPFSREPLAIIIRHLEMELVKLIGRKLLPHNPLAYPRLALLLYRLNGGEEWSYVDLEKAEETTRRIMDLAKNYRNKYGKNPFVTELFGKNGELSFYEFDEQQRQREKLAEDEYVREQEEREKREKIRMRDNRAAWYQIIKQESDREDASWPALEEKWRKAIEKTEKEEIKRKTEAEGGPEGRARDVEFLAAIRERRESTLKDLFNRYGRETFNIWKAFREAVLNNKYTTASWLFNILLTPALNPAVKSYVEARAFDRGGPGKTEGVPDKSEILLSAQNVPKYRRETGVFEGVGDDEKAEFFQTLQKRGDKNAAGALVWLKKELGENYVKRLLER